MDYIKVILPVMVYKKFHKRIRKFCTIENVEPKEFDYSKDDIWKELKSKSTKAYKAVKEREFKIRKNLL
jgi:hypothetical protein